ncbi:hypothetical protein [Bradyrhizobium sp. RT10b]|uniref:hypothetical protein n=1 Tax=Bradyrhizobium sp. RT10b TaxID=3156331 RepID=UPI0033958151
MSETIAFAVPTAVIAWIAWLVARRIGAVMNGWPLRIQARYVSAGRPADYHDRLKATRALYAAWTHEEATVWSM